MNTTDLITFSLFGILIILQLKGVMELKVRAVPAQTEKIALVLALAIIFFIIVPRTSGIERFIYLILTGGVMILSYMKQGATMRGINTMNRLIMGIHWNRVKAIGYGEKDGLITLLLKDGVRIAKLHFRIQDKEKLFMLFPKDAKVEKLRKEDL